MIRVSRYSFGAIRSALVSRIGCDRAGGERRQPDGRYAEGQSSTAGPDARRGDPTGAMRHGGRWHFR
jgi:hypothetical protein